MDAKTLLEKVDALLGIARGNGGWEPEARDILRDIRATLLTPQAVEDRARGEAVRELDALSCKWGRDWPSGVFEAVVEGVAINASSEERLLAEVRARLAPDVAEALRQAGATGRVLPGAGVWQITDSGGILWSYPDTVEGREKSVEQAQAHDNRKPLAEWAAANGEEAAVLAACMKRGWDFGVYFSEGKQGKEHMSGQCGRHNHDNDIIRCFAVACEVAGVPTPWGPDEAAAPAARSVYGLDPQVMAEVRERLQGAPDVADPQEVQHIMVEAMNVAQEALDCDWDPGDTDGRAAFALMHVLRVLDSAAGAATTEQEG